MKDCPERNCQDLKKCLEVLDLILDNEATLEDQVFFNEHIEECIVCFSQYNIEKQIRELIRTKVRKQPVPQELVSAIKNSILDGSWETTKD